MENRRSKTSQMRCKKHPKHKQSPGVCSICLRERLSQLSSKNKTPKRPSSYSSSSSLSSLSSIGSSSNASSCSSPVHYRSKNYRNGRSSEVSFLKVSGKNIVFTKSRSMEFYPREEMEKDYNGKRKGGFWSKLFGSTSKKKMDLMHSRTMRERLPTGFH